MLKIQTLAIVAFTAIWLSGCATDQSPKVVHAPGSDPLEPVTDRPGTRVYLEEPGTMRPPGVNPTDVVVAGSISELLRTPSDQVTSDNIRALVRNGVVTLQGTVPTSDLKRELEDRISIMPGVKSVDNQLQIELR
ncbi:MAG TPA: BON domain-containing protein [Clostridia bacterium]|nr:BON domain-containing protein [Clostridia bacterium]